MKAKFVIVPAALSILLTGCVGQSGAEIDPIKGMDLSMCTTIKPDVEEANKIFWALGKPYSMQDFFDSMSKVTEEVNAAASVSVDPAKTWLNAVASNGGELVRFFAGDDSGATEELILRASRWKASVQEMSRYCS